MVFMPIFTTFFMFVVGLVGAARFPGLGRLGSEQVALILLTDMAQQFPGIRVLLVLFVSAAIGCDYVHHRFRVTCCVLHFYAGSV